MMHESYAISLLSVVFKLSRDR